MGKAIVKIAKDTTVIYLFTKNFDVKLINFLQNSVLLKHRVSHFRILRLLYRFV